MTVLLAHKTGKQWALVAFCDGFLSRERVLRDRSWRCSKSFVLPSLRTTPRATAGDPKSARGEGEQHLFGPSSVHYSFDIGVPMSVYVLYEMKGDNPMDTG